MQSNFCPHKLGLAEDVEYISQRFFIFFLPPHNFTIPYAPLPAALKKFTEPRVDDLWMTNEHDKNHYRTMDEFTYVNRRFNELVENLQHCIEIGSVFSRLSILNLVLRTQLMFLK